MVGGGHYRTLTPHNEIEEPGMQRWREARHLMSSPFLFSSQYRSCLTRSHSHALESTRTDTSAGAVGNMEVKESLSGFLSVPIHSSFNDVRACEQRHDEVPSDSISVCSSVPQNRE